MKEILMWNIWVQLAIISSVMITYLVYTIVFCFWFIYLIDAMKRKRSFYKTTLRCIEGESDPHEQILAYNAKTDLVKFVSLFCLNLVEWVGVSFCGIALVLHFVGDYRQEFPANHSLSVPGEWDTKLNIPYIHNTCVVVTMAIIGSLCMYLSAKYAQRSWIISNGIPFWICFLLFSSIVAEILVTLCYTHIVGIWCDIMLVTLSVIFAWKQYKKLNMVLQWSIVDLRVSGDIKLLEKHVRMKRRFNRIFTTIWIGISCILVSEYTNVLSQTAQVILRMSTHSITGRFLCETTRYSHFDSYLFAFLYLLEGSLTIIGSLFIFIPYISYGLCTMYVVLWRLFKGKTGYRTHFQVQLIAPLI